MSGPLAVVLLSLAGLGGCRSVAGFDRPSMSSRPGGPSPALVFDGEAVRAARAQADAGLDALSPEYARNDRARGVRTPASASRDRLYRSSDWFGPPIVGPAELRARRWTRHRPRFFDETTPLLSPSRERGAAPPY
ncbi:MAG: hypothetical protein D6693_05735 [Planctomycetota bacterium]|nr:MAG: hypothetical protein D6693_05735 [Planctomycetota bacterium]